MKTRPMSLNLGSKNVASEEMGKRSEMKRRMTMAETITLETVKETGVEDLFPSYARVKQEQTQKILYAHITGS